MGAEESIAEQSVPRNPSMATHSIEKLESESIIRPKTMAGSNRDFSFVNRSEELATDSEYKDCAESEEERDGGIGCKSAARKESSGSSVNAMDFDQDRNRRTES